MNNVANTILRQMGGIQFLLAFSIKPYILAETLRLRIPTNQSGANYVDIHYDRGVDTYTMHFYKKRKVRGVLTITDIRTESNVYNDSLNTVFNYVTGLAPL